MIKNVPRLTAEEALMAVVEWVSGPAGCGDNVGTAPTGTTWIGVDGLGGAGKTSFADRLQERLPGSAVIHVDDFFRPGVDGWDRGGFVREILEPVRAGRPGHYRRWDWVAEEPGEPLTVRPGGILIVEGVSSTDVRLGVDWEVTLWLDAPADLRWNRVMDRDGEAFRDTWLNVWLPSEQAYEAAQHPQSRVDLIVSITP